MRKFTIFVLLSVLSVSFTYAIQDKIELTKKRFTEYLKTYNYEFENSLRNKMFLDAEKFSGNSEIKSLKNHIKDSPIFELVKLQMENTLFC